MADKMDEQPSVPQQPGSYDADKAKRAYRRVFGKTAEVSTRPNQAPPPPETTERPAATASPS